MAVVVSSAFWNSLKGYKGPCRTRRPSTVRSVACQAASHKKVADVWEKDVWEFQAKSGSSGSCRLFFHFLGKSQFENCLGEHLEVPDILLPDIRGLLISKGIALQEGVVEATLASLALHCATMGGHQTS